MGFVGLLKFAFLCFDFLAWPIFALGCPLYASVQAIETNSNSDMRNLVAYWIIFSLISLFELAFVRLIDWLPFWPYMKLLAICWLVVPHFNGACYVYECLLRPCLSVNPQIVVKYLIKPKENPSLIAESFLAVAERYVKENGSEALEKLIDSKSNHTKPNTDVEEIKEVTNTEEEEETAAAIQPKFIVSTVVKDDTLDNNKSVELPQKNPIAATNSMKPKVPSVGKENAKSWETKEKNPVVTTERTKFIEPIVDKDNALDDTKAVELTHKNPIAVTSSFKPKMPNIAKENAKSWKIEETNLAATTERPQFIEPTIAKDDALDDTKAVEVTQKNPTKSTNSFIPKVRNIAKENAKSWKIKEKNSAVTTTLPKFIEPTIVKDDALDGTKAVELPQKSPTAATNSFKPKVPNITKENAKSWKVKEKNPADTTDSNFTQIEKKTVGARELKKRRWRHLLVERTKYQKFVLQRESTCALCQVKTTTEDLDYHLQGKKHKAKCEELKASKRTKTRVARLQKPMTTTKPKKPVFGDGPNKSNTKKQEGMVQTNQTAKPCKPVVPKFWCGLFDAKCLSEIDLASHINGQKHLSSFQSMIDSLSKGQIGL
ncbi:HVA22-like protein [Actinidia chinensis var. chinensis]|uniref:HVA22-like protein n=1 Tax=Actinidia chinensis var. chinensis TaxID=1590841 RepID=A0A2R6Q5Q5_ACTCC|nr:HVA22-like protein [Actinidia chinensis var. chinensis]